MFDKQKLILTLTKYSAYFINIVIIGVVGYGLYMWITLLIQEIHS